MAVTVATCASARAHTVLHAWAPLGQWPSGWQSWAAPGSPPIPTQVHDQQPHSAGLAQAAPGGVSPGTGPTGASAQPDAQAVTQARSQVHFTPPG